MVDVFSVPEIHLLDGLDAYGDELRDAAGRAEWNRVFIELPNGDEVGSDLIAPAPGRLSTAAVSAISDRLGARARLLGASYRFGEAGGGERWRVVGGGSGPEDGSHVAVISLAGELARSRPKTDGIAFWRHNASGHVGGESPPVLDRFTMAAWSMMGLVPLIDSRVVLVPLDAFMSVWPMEASGTGLDDGRLIWAAYVDIG